MKTPAERGPIGAWAVEARDEADLSVPQVVERLAAKGYVVRESTIRGIEGGSKKPGRRLLRLLGDIYERKAPGEPAVTPPETTLADALAALAREMEASRIARGRLEKVEARLEAVEGLVRVLTAASDPVEPRLGVREATAGSQ
jgi:hypothetical protein